MERISGTGFTFEAIPGTQRTKVAASAGVPAQPRRQPLNAVIDTVIAEAGGEGPEGMAAVANVIKNRSTKAGTSPEDVVRAPHQFEGYGKQIDPKQRAQAEQIVNAVFSGQAPDNTGGADHFHADSVNPDWAGKMPKTARIGGHTFYASGEQKAPKTPGIDRIKTGSIERGPLRANWASVEKLGNPASAEWQSQNLTTIEPVKGQRWTVYKPAAAAFAGLIQDLEAAGYPVSSSGGHNVRNIRGSSKLSQHAFGTAIDLNAATNPMLKGKLQTDLPPNIREIAAKHGLVWGGDFKGRPDPMHFEYVGGEGAGVDYTTTASTTGTSGLQRIVVNADTQIPRDTMPDFGGVKSFDPMASFKARSPAASTPTDPFARINAGRVAQGLQPLVTMDPAKYPKWKEKFDANQPGVMSDIANLLYLGTVGTLESANEAIKLLPGGDKIAAGLSAVNEWATGSTTEEQATATRAAGEKALSASMKKARKKDWVKDDWSLGDAWKDPRSYLSGVVESIPGTAITMTPAGLLAKGAYATKLASGIAAGLTEVAAKKAAAAAAAKAAWIAGGIGEGALAGGSTAKAVKDELGALPQDVWDASDAYQTLLDQGMSPEDAKASIIDDKATQAGIIAGIATGIVGGSGDAVLSQIISKGVKGTVLRRLAKGAGREAVAEAGEEAVQGAAEQVSTNVAVGAVDPTRTPGQGVANAAVGGAIAGGIMGGGMGAAAGAVSPAEGETPPPAPPEAGTEGEAGAEPIVPPAGDGGAGAAPLTAEQQGQAAATGAPGAPRGPLTRAMEHGEAEAQGVVNQAATAAGAPPVGSRVRVDYGEGISFEGTVQGYTTDGNAHIIDDENQEQEIEPEFIQPVPPAAEETVDPETGEVLPAQPAPAASPGAAGATPPAGATAPPAPAPAGGAVAPDVTPTPATTAPAAPPAAGEAAAVQPSVTPETAAVPGTTAAVPTAEPTAAEPAAAEPAGEGAPAPAAPPDLQTWWDEELSPQGRRRVAKAAGLKGSPHTMWRRFDAGQKSAIAAAYNREGPPAEAEPTPAPKPKPKKLAKASSEARAARKEAERKGPHPENEGYYDYEPGGTPKSNDPAYIKGWVEAAAEAAESGTEGAKAPKPSIPRTIPRDTSPDHTAKYIDHGIDIALPNGDAAKNLTIDRWKSNGHENMVILDVNGDVVANGEGKDDTVSISERNYGMMSDPNESLVVHHNHPDVMSLSEPDLGMAAMPGVKAIYAHSPDGKISYRVEMLPKARAHLLKGAKLDYANASDAFAQALNILNMRGKPLVAGMVQAIKDGHMTRDQANDEYHHIFNSALQDGDWVIYDASGKDRVSPMLAIPSIKSAYDEIVAKCRRNVGSTGNGRPAEPLRHPGEITGIQGRGGEAAARPAAKPTPAPGPGPAARSAAPAKPAQQAKVSNAAQTRDSAVAELEALAATAEKAGRKEKPWRKPMREAMHKAGYAIRPDGSGSGVAFKMGWINGVRGEGIPASANAARQEGERGGKKWIEANPKRTDTVIWKLGKTTYNIGDDAETLREFAKRIGKLPLGHFQEQTGPKLKAVDKLAWQRWFGKSKVVDDKGNPLAVYRGEHGPAVGDFQTRLPSLSFGSAAAANVYARTSNTTGETAHAPRVTPVYLRIENPVLDNRDDPFIDFKDIAAKLGQQVAEKLARAHASHIENTNNWEENFSWQAGSVGDLLNIYPQKLNDLYMDAYVLLDDPDFVAAAKAKGYDGAIHIGNGETFDDIEYRIFDARQAKSVHNQAPTEDVHVLRSIKAKITPSGYQTDNPGGRWLEGKQRRAEADMAEGTSAWHGLQGSTTASAGMDTPLYLPVSLLRHLRGRNLEQPAPGKVKYDELAKSVKAKGYTDENPVFVMVNHKGHAFLNEGNNRVAVANANGIRKIRAWVHWMNGAELTQGAWDPASVAEMEQFANDEPALKSRKPFESSVQEDGDSPSRISTRYPDLVSSPEDPIVERLSVGIESMKAEPNKGAFAHNMRLIASYVNMPRGMANRQPDFIARRMKEHVKANLRWLYDQVPPEQRERTKLWYDGARAITDRWMEKYQQPDHVIAGVLAAMSPQKDWYQNVSLAERVLDIMTFTNNKAWTNAMGETAHRIFAGDDKASMLNRIRGKTLEQINEQYADDPHNFRLQAMWVRVYDETYHDPRHRQISSEGDFVGEAVDKVGWGSLAEIAKGIAVIRDPAYDNVSRRMGYKHKVRSFFNNILAPNAKHGDITMDTHAIAAALLRALSGSSAEVYHNFGTSPLREDQPRGWRAARQVGVSGTSGTYGLYADAYRELAADLGILPRELQSITWEAVRGLFTNTFKQQASNVAAIDAVWMRVRNGQISADAARSEILRIAGGINAPSWYGPGAAIAGGAQPSTYARELPEGGLRQADTEAVDGGAGGGAAAAVSESGIAPELASIRTTIQAIGQNLTSPSKWHSKDRLTSMKTRMTKHALGALYLNYLPDLAPTAIKDLVERYLGEKRAMDTYKNTIHQSAHTIVEQWQKYSKLGKDRVADLHTLMHDATIAGVDPDDTVTPANIADPQYTALRARFTALPALGQEVYRSVRDEYKKQNEEMDRLLVAQARQMHVIADRKRGRDLAKKLNQIANNPALSAAEKAQQSQDARDAKARADLMAIGRANVSVNGLRRKLGQNKVKAPYFPLGRFGKYYVAVRNPSGDLEHFELAESQYQSKQNEKRIRAAYPGWDIKTGKMSEHVSQDNVVGKPSFLVEIEQLLPNTPDKATIMDQLWQRYLRTALPTTSIRSKQLHRNAIEGYSQDALRVFANHMFHAGHQMGKLKHGLELADLVDETKRHAEEMSTDNTQAIQIYDELVKRHEWVMNPGAGTSTALREAGQWATRAAFIWYLGASPAAAMVNLGQTPMIGIPIMGARFGSMAKAASAVAKASRNPWKNTGLSAAEVQAMQDMEATGLIDSTQSIDIQGVGEEGLSYSPTTAKVMRTLGYLFHKAEVANRRVTALAAYRLAVAEGQNHNQAVRTAEDITWKTHFDYSNSSRPRISQRPEWRILLAMRSYQINMLYRLGRDMHQAFKGMGSTPAETKQIRKEARYQIAAILGMQALVAGGTGIVGYNTAFFLYGIMATMWGAIFGGDDDEDPFTAQERFKETVLEVFGPVIGNVLLKGPVGAATGVDLTNRLGMPDLFFKKSLEELDTGKDQYQYLMQQLFGAPFGIVEQMFKASDQFAQGNFMRSGEGFLPKVAKDVLKSYRYLTEGLTQSDGDVVMANVGYWAVIAQAAGFTPANVAEQWDKSSALKGAERRLKVNRQAYINSFAMAVKNKDDDGRQEALEKIRKFNKSPYGRTMPIKGSTLTSSLKHRAIAESKRERGGGVYISNEALRRQLQLGIPAMTQ